MANVQIEGQAASGLSRNLNVGLGGTVPSRKHRTHISFGKHVREQGSTRIHW
jgi:hypothetical protein